MVGQRWEDGCFAHAAKPPQGPATSSWAAPCSGAAPAHARDHHSKRERDGWHWGRAQRVGGGGTWGGENQLPPCLCVLVEKWGFVGKWQRLVLPRGQTQVTAAGPPRGINATWCPAHHAPLDLTCIYTRACAVRAGGGVWGCGAGAPRGALCWAGSSQKSGIFRQLPLAAGAAPTHACPA